VVPGITPCGLASRSRLQGFAWGATARRGEQGTSGGALVNNSFSPPAFREQITTLSATGTEGGMAGVQIGRKGPGRPWRATCNLQRICYEVKPKGDIAAGAQFFFGKGQMQLLPHGSRARGNQRTRNSSSPPGANLDASRDRADLSNPTAQIGRPRTASCPSGLLPQENRAVVNVRCGMVHERASRAARAGTNRQTETLGTGALHILTMRR